MAKIDFQPDVIKEEPGIGVDFEPVPPVVPPPVADPQDITLDKYVQDIVSTAGQTGYSLDVSEQFIKSRQLLKKEQERLREEAGGKIGFWEAAVQDAETKLPFSLAGAVQANELIMAAKRMSEDAYEAAARRQMQYPLSEQWILEGVPSAEELEKRDTALITNYLETMATRELRGYTGIGKFGAAVSVVPAWMIEFAATGGLKKLGSVPAKAFLTKHLKSRLAGRLGGWVAGAAVRTTLGMPHRTVEATLRRRLIQDPENWATSISLGWGEVFIEALSEEAGGAMVKGAKVGGAGIVSKLPFGKKFLGALQVAWMEKTGGSAAQFAKKTFTQAGYHGMIGEIGEERLATLLHGLVGTEDFGAGSSAGSLARIIAGFKQDWENKYIELGVFGTIGAGQLATAKVAGKKEGKGFEVSEEKRRAEALRRQEEGLLPDVEEGELEVPEIQTEAKKELAGIEWNLRYQAGMIPKEELLKMGERAEELRKQIEKEEPTVPAEAPTPAEPVAPAEFEKGPVAKLEKFLTENPDALPSEIVGEAIGKPDLQAEDMSQEDVLNADEYFREHGFADSAHYIRWRTGQEVRAVEARKIQEDQAKLKKFFAEAAPITEAEPAKEDWQKTIETSLITAKKLKPVVAKEKTTELGKRVGKMAATMTGLREKGVRPEQAIAKSTATLKGELTEYNLRFEPIRERLPDEVIDSAFDSILESKRLRPLDKENTRKALTKLLDGSYLRLFESDLIADHFGMDMGKEARRRVPFGDSWTRTLAEYIGIPRTMLTAMSGDMSGIMRQARPLGQVYPKEFADFVVKSVKAWGSEEAFRKMEEESLALPFIDEAATDGVLEGTKYGEAVGEPVERGEEFIGAGPLEKIPIVKYPIKAAERAFTVLNIFRRAVYSKIRTGATRTGTDTMSVADRKRIAGIINDMSGRAHVKRTKAVKALMPYLQALFAPRFRIARVRAPFRMPIEMARFGWRRFVTGERLNLPELRMTAGAFASTIATNLSIMYLIRAAYLAWGGDPEDIEIEPDLRATDGGKLRMKDMHIDLWMGYLQDFQTYTQLATGQAKSQAGELYDIDRVDILKRAIRKRTRPFVSLVVDAITGETVSGKRFGAAPKGKEGKILESWEVPEWLQGAGIETWNRTVPLVAQDAVDALIIEGVPEAITMGALSHFGISVATYEKWAASELKVFKNQLAMNSHGKKWDKLRPDQQKKFAPQLEQLELLADQERPLRPRSKFVSKEEEQQKERMFKAMPQIVRTGLKEIGADLGGISRTNVIGLDKLDDERFEYYEKQVIRYAKDDLKLLFRKRGWDAKPRSEKLKDVDRTINHSETGSKAKARERLKSEINKGNI